VTQLAFGVAFGVGVGVGVGVDVLLLHAATAALHEALEVSESLLQVASTSCNFGVHLQAAMAALHEALEVSEILLQETSACCSFDVHRAGVGVGACVRRARLDLPTHAPLFQVHLLLVLNVPACVKQSALQPDLVLHLALVPS